MQFGPTILMPASRTVSSAAPPRAHVPRCRSRQSRPKSPPAPSRLWRCTVWPRQGRGPRAPQSRRDRQDPECRRRSRRRDVPRFRRRRDERDTPAVWCRPQSVKHLTPDPSALPVRADHGHSDGPEERPHGGGCGLPCSRCAPIQESRRVPSPSDTRRTSGRRSSCWPTSKPDDAKRSITLRSSRGTQASNATIPSARACSASTSSTRVPIPALQNREQPPGPLRPGRQHPSGAGIQPQREAARRPRRR